VTSKDTKEPDKRAKLEIEYLVREVTVNDGYAPRLVFLVVFFIGILLLAVHSRLIQTE